MAKKKASPRVPSPQRTVEHVGWSEHPDDELTGLYKELNALYAKIHAAAEKLMPVGTCAFWAFGNHVRKVSIQAHDHNPHREPVFVVRCGDGKKSANVRALAVDNERENRRALRLLEEYRAKKAAEEAKAAKKPKKRAVKRKRAVS